MRTVTTAAASALVLASALASGASALAGQDRIYEAGRAERLSGSLLSEADGTAIWVLHAQCAGVFGAISAWEGERGQADAAAQARRQGVSHLNRALRRLETDRAIPRPAALDTAQPRVAAARARTLSDLNGQGLGAQSPANVVRSQCLEIDEAFPS